MNKGILRAAAIAAACGAWAGFAPPAHAYIGPAIAFVSYLFGPVAAVIAAIAMTVYLPVRLYLKKRKKKNAERAEEAAGGAEKQDNAAEN